MYKIKDLLDNLKKEENKKESNAKFVHRELPELKYSKILAIKNMANYTYRKTNDLIQNIDLELKKTPLVSNKDSQAFQHFINNSNNKIHLFNKILKSNNKHYHYHYISNNNNNNIK